MQYALLIYGSFDGWQGLSEDERQQHIQEYMALGQRPEPRGGAELAEARPPRPSGSATARR